MENKNFKQAEETLRKSMEDSKKWFSESSKTITETYNKQMDLSAGIYKKIIGSSFLSGGEENNFNNMFEIFQEKIEFFKNNIENSSSLFKDMAKTIFNPLSKGESGKWPLENTEAITETFRKQMELLANANKNYFDSINKPVKMENVNIDFKLLSDKFQKNAIDNMEASQKSIKAILESFSKHKGSSSDANKNLLGEINNLIDVSTNRTLSFWTEMLETINISKKEEGRVKQNGQVKKTTKKKLLKK